MRLSRDEKRALGFVALLLILAFAVRLREPDVRLAEDLAALDVTAAAAATAQLAAAGSATRPLLEGERLDVNTAPAEELQRLPRIGPALAERIVAERNANGGFRSGAELVARVPGIGDRMLELLEPHLSFGGLATSPARSSTGGAQLLDLNRATAAELESLPGIGPVLASRIIEHRARIGRFRDLTELDAVSGIGPATRARIAQLVTIGYQ